MRHKREYSEGRGFHIGKYLVKNLRGELCNCNRLSAAVQSQLIRRYCTWLILCLASPTLGAHDKTVCSDPFWRLNRVKGAQIREMSLATRFPRESDSDLWSDLQPCRGDEIV